MGGDRDSAAGSAEVLILGDSGGLGEALVRRLEVMRARGTTFTEGTDSELTIALSRPNWTAVAVVTHDDALALRLTLLSAHVRPDLPLWVTLFDKTLVHKLREVVPSVNVVGSSELVAQQLAELCCEHVPHHRLGIRNGLRIVDDALRLMVLSGCGLVATLLAQAAITMMALQVNVIDALYFSTRAVATVADPPHSDTAPIWFKVSSTLITVIAVVLLAVFTAALVRRLSRPRLTSLFGSRRAYARDHVLLVGFGQIGLRLAEHLHHRRIPVIALDSDPDQPCVRLARHAGIPVAIGRGDDREILELLGVGRCAVVAAVTSDDLANVSIGLAASDVRPDVPLVLRLGDGEVAAETESLLHLGSICDAHELVARVLAQAVTSPNQPPATTPQPVESGHRPAEVID